MSTELTLPAGFGPVSSVLAGRSNSNDELGQGIASSYGIMGFKGKVWTAKYQGNDYPLMRDDGDGPRNSIEVVIIKASPAISKIFYKNGYVDGSTAAPDCWSANGVNPDASVQQKQNATCADCAMNAWGSRVTEAGKQGKQCSDSRRIAIIPIADLENEMFGGPMLLRIPAASLKDLKAYGDFMNSYQFNYYAVVTRISFDPKEAYPKFVFSAVRPLTDAEAQRIVQYRDHDPRIPAVLSETQASATPAGNAPAPAAVPASPFEQPVPPAAPVPAPAPAAVPASPFEQPVPPAAPVPAPAPAPAPTPVAAAPANPFGGPTIVSPAEQSAPAPQPAPQPAVQPAAPAAQPAPVAQPAAMAPAGFDDLLDNILNS
jgi:hypothetical protein